ncbi:MAG: DUF58 domain-containing protein [Vicinamibacterales bacterium]
MRVRDDDAGSLVSLADITEIELVILRRMRDVTIGDHRSRQHGSGFDFVGLRDWQPGDRFSSIDWGQSSLTNFSPLVVRDFEQPSTATVVAVADASLSTRCGVNGVPIAKPVARAIATVGLSAVFFQDPFGLITFDTGFEHLGGIRPRTGKGHVVHCLDAYERQKGLQEIHRSGSISATLSGYMRNPSLLVVISDFLIESPETTLRELSLVRATHDLFLVMVDSAFAFQAPPLASGWVDIVDVETGRVRTVSRHGLAELAGRARDWQDRVRRLAKDLDLDVVTVQVDEDRSDIALSEFVAERRLKKTYN